MGDFDSSFWFIEPDPEHRESLKEQVGGVELKEGVRVEGVMSSTFEECFPVIVESLQKDGNMPPTFAFVDPNGYTGVKMSTLTAFLRLRRCEFLFTFMERSLQRFISLPEGARKKKLDELFGTDRWKDALSMRGSEQIQFFLELYTQQLKDNGIQYTQTFEMCDENEQTIYHLVFATNSKKGLEVMKEAMVKVDPKFTFRVSDAMMPGQTHLFSFENNKDWYRQAARLIFQEYAGKTSVPLDDIECFVITDTPYVYRAGIINLMKKSGHVVDKTPYEPRKKMKKELRYKVTFAEDDEQASKAVSDAASTRTTGQDL